MDPYTIQRLNDRGIISYMQISALSNDEITVIEEEFDIEIDDSEVEDLESINALVDLVKDRI